jgi:hypothetical protein
MARVTFTIPDSAYEPEPATLERLLDELDRLHRDGANYDGPAAAHRIRDARQSAAEVAKLDLVEWPGSERIALVRALDHLFNSHDLNDEAAQRLREAHTFPGMPTRYEVRSFLAGELKPTRFSSNTGEYEPGDRIVVGDGTAWKVIEVEAGDSRPRLVLDDA